MNMKFNIIVSLILAVVLPTLVAAQSSVNENIEGYTSPSMDFPKGEVQVGTSMEYNWTDVLQGIGSLASAIISLFGFYFLWRQIKQTNVNLRQSDHTAVYSINTSIYKFFAENSEIRPYFYDRKHLSVDDENRNKVLCAAELIADFFEYIMLEKNSLAPDIRDPFKNYIKMIYSNSYAFREFIDTHKHQYSSKLLRMFAKIDMNAFDMSIVVRGLLTDMEFERLDKIYAASDFLMGTPNILGYR